MRKSQLLITDTDKPVLENVFSFVYLLSLLFICVFYLACAQLEIYDMIGQAISNSRRAGGEVSQPELHPSAQCEHFTSLRL